MELTVQHLRCFLAVAEELNFTRAAARLQLSPSTVSEQIAHLERRTGHPLFVRTSRTVTRTQAAEELFPLARRVVSAMDAVTTWATAPDSSSTVAIGVMGSSEQFRALVVEARAAAPGVEWRIRQLGFHPPFEPLLRHELDAAVLTELGPAKAVEGIATYDLWRERLVLVVREDHRLVERRRARLDDLTDQVLICGPNGLKNKQWFATIRELIPGDPTVLNVANNLEESVEMCAAGIGVNVASESVMQMFYRPGLAFVPLDDAPTATTRLHVRRGEPSRAIADFVDLARTARAPHA
jgi:DNA-binding transcriptional LysR family regulator